MAHALSDLAYAVSDMAHALSDMAHALSDMAHALSDMAHALSDMAHALSDMAHALSDMAHPCTDTGNRSTDAVANGMARLHRAASDAGTYDAGATHHRFDPLPNVAHPLPHRTDAVLCHPYPIAHVGNLRTESRADVGAGVAHRLADVGHRNSLADFGYARSDVAGSGT